ncbi:unnamed protein product [Scytosiphon promiscuus]
MTIHYDVKECEKGQAESQAGGSAGLSVPSGMSTAPSTAESSRDGPADKSEGLRTARWVKRQLLTRAPKTAEEIALDDNEELAVAKVRRKKELAHRAEQLYKAERLRKSRGPAGVMLARRERGRTALQAAERSAKRAKEEKVLRDEEARLVLIEAQKGINQSSSIEKTTPSQPTRTLLSLSLRTKHITLMNMNASGQPGSTGGEDPETRSSADTEAGLSALPAITNAAQGDDDTRGGDLVARAAAASSKNEVRLGQEKFFHETEQCCKRIVPCELGCGIRMREEEWLSPSLENPDVPLQQHHEEDECPRRLVPCGQRCGEWLPFEDLMKHMKVSCVKRPFPPVKCRLGCGEEFHGGLHRMLQSEEERIDHEHELCQHRLLHCVWAGCEEMVMAKDRRKHGEEHVIRSGVFLYTVPGKYTFKVSNYRWGGALSRDFRFARGVLRVSFPISGFCGLAAAGCILAILYVTPEEELEVTVGGGGPAGEYGSEIEVPRGLDEYGKAVSDMVDQHGCAFRGQAPHGRRDCLFLNPLWRPLNSFKRSISSYGGGRTEPLVVAGAGGGGGSRSGVPGGGLNGEIPGTKMDMRNGRMGTATQGGEAGDSGDVSGCTFPPEHGRAWAGGNGGQYGGGGGSGWFGGGGGGTSPGIVGAGGGGSCYINTALSMDFVVLQGVGRVSGGTNKAPPRARGFSEDDIVGGICGEGGEAGPSDIKPGNNGAVRIHKPGFFEKQLAHN